VIDDGLDLAQADRRTVERIAGRDTAALADLYDRHAGAVYSLALRIVSNPADAEEVVQDVFTQAWKQGERYDAARSTVAGWLLMMTRARAIDRLRMRQARPDTAAGDVGLIHVRATTITQETEAIDGQFVHRLRAALGSLPDSLRAPIELAYYEGLSHSAIASRLGEPLGTVKTRVRAALAKLRGALSLDGGR
jgi:RNA polymerase sigma-70 factor (ECF subfamily)